MVLHRYLSVLCPLCMLLGACGGGGAGNSPTDSNNPAISQSGNNIAILSGEQLGIATENNADLSKPVTVTQSSADFAVKQARISLDDTQGSYYFVIIQLTNISTQILCSVTLNNINYQSVSNGTTINRANDPAGYVLGNYGVTNGGLDNYDCIAPGQTGYFLDGIQGDGNYKLADLQNIDIGSIQIQNTADKLSSSQVLPIGYSVVSGSQGNTAKVTVKNYNNYAVQLYSPHCYYILLDSNNSPLIWGYFLTNPTTVNIAANQSLEIQGGVSFTGSAQKMLVYLDFTAD